MVADATPEVAADDLESLKKRNEELEAAAKDTQTNFDARLQALQERNTQSEGILRDRYLRKSTVADSTLRVLEAVQAEEGASEADVSRAINELKGTMHPSSASYAAPTAVPATATEDQTLVMNNFLNEKRMTGDESNEFGNWVTREANTAMSKAEIAVADQSLDGFLRIAHSRWEQSVQDGNKEEQRSDAVGAIKSVQRTQRAAAKAASGSTGAAKKQPTGPTQVDVAKLTPDDVSALMRQAQDQYK